MLSQHRVRLWHVQMLKHLRRRRMLMRERLQLLLMMWWLHLHFLSVFLYMILFVQQHLCDALFSDHCKESAANNSYYDSNPHIYPIGNMRRLDRG